MPKRIATPEERAKALEVYMLEGPTRAAQVVGFSKASVCAWAKEAGVKTEAPGLVEGAAELSVARRKLSMAEWREEMTELLRQISVQAGTVEAQLLAKRGKSTPTLEKATSARVKSVSDLLLLTGEATQRIGLSGDVTEQQEAVSRLRDELAERRAEAARRGRESA